MTYVVCDRMKRDLCWTRPTRGVPSETHNGELHFPTLLGGGALQGDGDRNADASRRPQMVLWYFSTNSYRAGAYATRGAGVLREYAQ